ncbi:hypothetical protein ACFYTS_08775 [Nocardia sp. NPDC004151]|uniref:hypothetical protein n=1 Tax=Nocardia sp. NPDC004151 TaxID=3364304 RepID=UPI0036C06B3A
MGEGETVVGSSVPARRGAAGTDRADRDVRPVDQHRAVRMLVRQVHSYGSAGWNACGFCLVQQHPNRVVVGCQPAQAERQAGKAFGKRTVCAQLIARCGPSGFAANSFQFFDAPLIRF